MQCDTNFIVHAQRLLLHRTQHDSNPNNADVITLQRFEMKLATSAILISLVRSAVATHTADEKYVTCGSTIKLAHIESGGRFLLTSDERSLQSGSGQQLVTAAVSTDSHNALWQIREADGAPACELGKPIKCGDVIRLTHLNTSNNLHTHGHQSPLSRQHEVTGFGNGQGEGDKGDDWKVVCSGGEYWLREEQISFKSMATSRHLGAASNAKFTQQNCGRGCPILDHLEVFGRQPDDQHTKWKTEVGVYLYK